MLASTIYVDFGVGLSSPDGLEMADASSANLNGPQVFQDGYLVTTLENQLIDRSFDAAQRESFYKDILGHLRIHFRPFDVVVQRADSADLDAIATSLASTPTNDAYVFVGGSVPSLVQRDVGAAVLDVGNHQDNLGFVFSGFQTIHVGADYQPGILAGQIAKQAALTFGARATEGSAALAYGNLMSMQGTDESGNPTGPEHFHRRNFGGFVRRELPLVMDLGVSPGTENSFEVLKDVLGESTGGVVYVTLGGPSANGLTIQEHSDGTVDLIDEGLNLQNIDISSGLIVSLVDYGPSSLNHPVRFQAAADNANFVQDGIRVRVNDNITIESNANAVDLNLQLFGSQFDDTFQINGGDWLKVFAEGGNDTIEIDNVDSTHSVIVNAGKGDDHVRILNMDARIFVVDGGTGTDALDFSEAPDMSLPLWDLNAEGFDFRSEARPGLSSPPGAMATIHNYLNFDHLTGSTHSSTRMHVGSVSFGNGSIPAPIQEKPLIVQVEGQTTSFSLPGLQRNANNLAGVVGQNVFVLSTSRDMSVGGGYVQISSDIDWRQGRSDTIQHNIRAGPGYVSQQNFAVVISNVKGDGLNVNVTDDNIPGVLANQITGATGGTIYVGQRLYFGTMNVVIHGSDTAADHFAIQSSSRLEQVTLFGHGGDDGFEFGSMLAQGSGDLDELFEKTEIVPRVFAGDGFDYVYLDDQASQGEFHYELTDASVRDVTPGTDRLFSEIQFADTEIVRMTSNTDKNVFRIDPSPNVIFRVDGNQPGEGDGDALALIGNLPSKRHHVVKSGPGNGVWFFGNDAGADRLVVFDSIEFVSQSDRFALASQQGTEPRIRVYETVSNRYLFTIQPYESGFRGGLSVETADMNNDGIPDIIVGPGQGRSAEVRIFDGRNGVQIDSFSPFPAGYRGGVDVAVGNLYDGFEWEIAVAGLRVNNVRIFQADEAGDFQLRYGYSPFDGNGPSGVRISTGDITGDGYDEVISTPLPGWSPEVSVYTIAHHVFGHLEPWRLYWSQNELTGHVDGYLGGFTSATGDIDGDGDDDLFLAGINTGSANDPFSGQIRTFAANGYTTPRRTEPTLQPFQRQFTRGVSMTTRDLDLDGIIDHVFASRLDNGNGGRIVVMDASGRYVTHFLDGDSAFRNGIEIG